MDLIKAHRFNLLKIFIFIFSIEIKISAKIITTLSMG